jgi:UDP:flavonoid glycosyltransferase YjiC (YdhE family)
MLGVFADRGVGQDLLDAVGTREADLVVIDALAFGALDAARRAGLRYAVLEHMYDAAYRSGILGGPMGLNLLLRRLAPRRALDAAAVRLLTTLPELDPVDAPNLRQVGPVVSWSPRVEGEPTVVIGLSTFGYAGMARVLQRLVDAAEGVAARVLVSTGPVVAPTALRAPTGVEVQRWLPHGEVLPSTSVLVTHGGHGSTMAALAHDVPLLVVPLDAKSDHRRMGRSVEAVGAGRMVSRRSSPDQLRDALDALLAEGPHRAAAARLGAAIRATEAVSDGADALESALGGPGIRAGGAEPGPRAARP